MGLARENGDLLAVHGFHVILDPLSKSLPKVRSPLASVALFENAVWHPSFRCHQQRLAS